LRERIKKKKKIRVETQDDHVASNSSRSKVCHLKKCDVVDIKKNVIYLALIIKFVLKLYFLNENCQAFF